jgi:hypothetical protein
MLYPPGHLSHLIHVVLSEEPEVPEDMDTEESPILDDLRYNLFSPTNN